MVWRVSSSSELARSSKGFLGTVAGIYTPSVSRIVMRLRLWRRVDRGNMSDPNGPSKATSGTSNVGGILRNKMSGIKNLIPKCWRDGVLAKSKGFIMSSSKDRSVTGEISRTS